MEFLLKTYIDLIAWKTVVCIAQLSKYRAQGSLNWIQKTVYIQIYNKTYSITYSFGNIWNYEVWSKLYWEVIINASLLIISNLCQYIINKADPSLDYFQYPASYLNIKHSIWLKDAKSVRADFIINEVLG